jgi:ceramide glucosyltransferase
MTFWQTALVLWLVLTALPLWAAMALASFRIGRGKRRLFGDGGIFPPIEVLVPVTGALPEHETALKSLLEQNYPSYRVLFIVETQDDPANAVVDVLCAGYPHAAKVISGTGGCCAQKNQNLVEATKRLRSDTEVLVFCDSTNEAHSGWLERLTAAVRAADSEVVTTFRTFDPQPPTVGGVCQAMYAAFLLLFAVNRPTPWGGATAIRRRTFEQLRVVDMWSRTVVDDLVLGNLLAGAGVPVTMDPGALLSSTVRGQTIRGFLSYLDRQVLFPKFTNPGMWMQASVLYLNLTAAIGVSVLLGLAACVGWATPFVGYCCGAFLCSILIFVGLLRQFNRFAIPWRAWLVSILPCVFLTGFVFARSLTRNHIDWHGKRYWPGKEGVVLKVDLLGRQ